MKTNFKIFSPILLALLFSMIILNATAQNGNEGPKNHQQVQGQNQAPSATPDLPDAPMPPPPPPPPPPPAVEPMDDTPSALDLPDLSDNQKADIKALRLKQMQSMTPYRNQIREKTAHLTTLLTTAPADLAAADAVADELGKIHASVLKLMIHHDQALRNLLTPDQQVIFDTRPKPFLRKMK
ncbi:MAG: periplasmic heavy metal sensor [Bacteroidetes bacterium]|nr:periplasmic heavy metal sensor [Bacteroidota bacterium]